MQRMTSAYANKLLKRLNDDKDYYRNIEADSYMYIAAVDEEPVIPEYNYTEISTTIREIDEKIVEIKHAINLANTTNTIMVGNEEMTIDSVLIRMAQLNSRRGLLDKMRKALPVLRLNAGYSSSRKTAPEYRYINYDIELAKADYERIESEIATMQIALDKYNQTVEFDVDI